jgi:DNA-binding winged helix-turn-helix (wHTH) protein/ketosteroid isomerase-like protein
MPCWAYLVGRMLTAPRVLIFGDFRFNVPTRELLRIGNDRSATAVSLGSRAAEILLLFLRKPGELVSKNEIMDAVWPGTAVEESNLTVQISALRRALGVSCIQTVPGRGYRWTLNVVAVDGTDAGRLFATPGMPTPVRVENASNAAWPPRGLLPAALPLTPIVDSGAPHRRFDGIAIPALLFPFMCALPAPAFVQDARPIAEQITRKWEQVVNAGDAAALTALYTKDAALLPHGIATPQIGETSIRRYYDDFVKITRRNLSLLVTESKMLSPDGVFMVGTWSAEVAGENGGAGTHRCGTYSSIFVREGSDWLCRADSWNEIRRPAK